MILLLERWIEDEGCHILFRVPIHIPLTDKNGSAVFSTVAVNPPPSPYFL